MNNLFVIAERCLYSNNIEEKLTLTHHAKQLFDCGKLDFCSDSPVLSMTDVRFPDKPIWLPARAMPKRKLTTPDGVAAFFHAIAHVEFVAIYLAWDIIYRFHGLPDAFYKDWLQVADEEAQHFALIRTHLHTIANMDYGDLPAHGGLWDHAQDTAQDVLARLALIPRCMEARGLDVTPALIEKFKQLGDAASVTLLTRILTDEVGHVERGSYWFKTFCQQQDFEPEAKYRELIGQYYAGGKPKGPFNREMRIIAGFSTAELDWLDTHP
jgi:uncharacterized ferritin-like protein (DUF455 family)